MDKLIASAHHSLSHLRRKVDRSFHTDTYLSGVQCFGTFTTKEEAGHIYDLAVRHIYGDEAVLNFCLLDYLVQGTQRLKPEWQERVPRAAYIAKERGVKRKRAKRGKGIQDA